jgi:radical SAM superfamily enzyme YgiQ (UPF0313 family)
LEVTLTRPDPGNERFGLGPFFRVEPLGLEYVAAALEAHGARVEILDGRFENLSRAVARKRSRIVGISCMHALEYDRAAALARDIRQRCPDAFIVAGGHAAAAYPMPLEIPEIDAICVGDGEAVMPLLLDALAGRGAIEDVPELRLRTRAGWSSTPRLDEAFALDRVPLPARRLVRR